MLKIKIYAATVCWVFHTFYSIVDDFSKEQTNKQKRMENNNFIHKYACVKCMFYGF